MDFVYDLVAAALTKWVTAIFAWLIALMLGSGALVHVFNILGKGGKPWSEFSLLMRVMDVVLLAFNLAVMIGLALLKPWAVFLLFAGIVCLQIIPYTIFRSHFVSQPEDHRTLNGLIATEVFMLVAFAAVLVWQGFGGGV